MENSNVNKIISTYDEYVALLEKEINSIIGVAIAHGYDGNEEGYKKGVELRNRLVELKEFLHNEGELYEKFLNEYPFIVTEYLSSNNLKSNLIKLIDNSEIKLLSYFAYPSCVRDVILSTNYNYKTPEQEWLNKFAERIEKEFPKYRIPIDNKIAIEFELISKKDSYKMSSLFFGSKDGEYYIGLSAENMDGVKSMRITKK